MSGNVGFVKCRTIYILFYSISNFGSSYYLRMSTKMAAAILSVNLSKCPHFSGIKCLNSFPHAISMRDIWLRYHPSPEKGTTVACHGQKEEGKVSHIISRIGQNQYPTRWLFAKTVELKMSRSIAIWPAPVNEISMQRNSFQACIDMYNNVV